MQIVEYPHPALRYRSKPLKKVDAALRAIVTEMFELMYQAKGIGLAANQVDLPYRLFIVNLTSDPQQQDQQWVFLNPVISRRQGMGEAEEGCLSFPGLYAQVARSEKIVVSAYGLDGAEINEELDGMLARVVQHETDHLDGVVFIDRLSPSNKLAVREALEEFELQFQGRRDQGLIPDDEMIATRLAALETERC